MPFIHFLQPIEDYSILCKYLSVRPLHCNIVIILCVSSYFMLFFPLDSMIYFFIVVTVLSPFCTLSHDLGYPFIKLYYSFLCSVHDLHVLFFVFNFFFLILQTSLRKPPEGGEKFDFFFHFVSFSSTLIIKNCTLEETVLFMYI